MIELLFYFFYPIAFYGLITDLIIFLFPGLTVLIQTAFGAAVSLPFLTFLYQKRRSDSEWYSDSFIPFSGKSLVFCMILGISFCLAGNILLLISGITRVSYTYENSINAIYQSSLLLQIISSGFLIPIAEEYVFRGLGFGYLSPRIGLYPAVLISSLVFAFYHGNLAQGIYAGINGLLLASVFNRYRTLKAPILVHIFANLTSILLTRLLPFPL